jgi:type IV pilus assembly protein PilV
MYNALHMKRPGKEASKSRGYFLPLTKSAGYTLLEVVVAVIILAIGILGLVGLQSATVRQNQNALAMSTATDYANSMMDKMRGNLEGAKGGFYFLKQGATTTAISPTGDEGYKAKEEVGRWLASLNNALPGVVTQICRMEKMSDTECHAGKGDYYRVAIDWSGVINDYSTTEAPDGKALFEKNTQCVKMVGRL